MTLSCYHGHVLLAANTGSSFYLYRTNDYLAHALHPVATAPAAPTTVDGTAATPTAPR